jgi:predicted transcriptional regulator
MIYNKAPHQLSLDFYPTKTRYTDPETSKKAARNVKAGTIRALILHTLNNSNLATFQIAAILDRDRDSISPHMKPLEELGYIKRTGQTIVREKTGQQCVIWEKIN